MPTWTAMKDLDTGDLVTATDMDAIRGNIEYLLSPNAGRTLYTGGAYTTTSTSFVDVDGAGTALEVTITTHGGPVLVCLTGSVTNNASGSRTYVDIAVDGTRLGRAGGLIELRHCANNAEMSAVISILVTGLAAGSHTFKPQWRTDANTSTFIGATTESPIGIMAIEL